MKKEQLKRLIRKEVKSSLKEGPRHNKRYGEKPPSGAQVKKQFKNARLALVELSNILGKANRSEIGADIEELLGGLRSLQNEFEQEGLAEDCGEDHLELEEDFTGVDDDTGKGSPKGGSKRFNKNQDDVIDDLLGDDKEVDYE